MDKYQKRYRFIHKKDILMWAKIWRERPENKKKIKERRNSPEGREYHRQYFKNHPEIALNSQKKKLAKLGSVLLMSGKEYGYALNAWANTVKKRDGFMCKECGSKDNLVAHHILHKSKYPESSLEVGNGTTLCKKHHYIVHGFTIENLL